jgi:hypothetical protein
MADFEIDPIVDADEFEENPGGDRTNTPTASTS